MIHQTAPSERAVETRRLSEVFDVSAPDHVAVQVFTDRTPDVPEIDPLYVFDKNQLKRVLQWLNGGFSKNLLLTGPTGCGKSSLILQVCARMNIEVFVVGCHAKLEFADMLGATQLVPGAIKDTDGLGAKVAAALTSLFKGADGQPILHWLQRSFSSVVSRFSYGAASLAALRGGVLLLDEVNFLPPGTIGALNTLLDSGPLLITETGELIEPQPGFRIAVTGNALDGGDDISLHRGVQRMNVAMLNRFLAMRCDYMTKLAEFQVVANATTLPGKLIEDLIVVANDTRQGFKSGAIETTISTRALLRWAKLLESQKPRIEREPGVVIPETLAFALLDAATTPDADAILNLLGKTIEGKQYPLDESAAGASANTQEPRGICRFLIDPNGGLPKYWGVIKRSDGETLFFGSLGDNPSCQDKPAGYFDGRVDQKLRNGYTEVAIPSALVTTTVDVRKLVCDFTNAIERNERTVRNQMTLTLLREIYSAGQAANLLAKLDALEAATA